jgi:hypothetical protein
VAQQNDPRVFSFWSFTLSMDARYFRKTLEGIDPRFLLSGLPSHIAIDPLTFDDAMFAEFLFMIVGNRSVSLLPKTEVPAGFLTKDDITRDTVWNFVHGAPALRKEIQGQIRACFPAAAQALQKAAIAQAESPALPLLRRCVQKKLHAPAQ